jgi:uncharacterized protein (TIGR03000 family)
MLRASICLFTRGISLAAVALMALATSAALAQAPSGLQGNRPYLVPQPVSRSSALHYNIYAPPSWLYPGYTYPYVPGGPNPSFQIQKSPPPTAEQPYPLGYHARSFAPPAFLNDTADVPLQNETLEQRVPQGTIYIFVPLADANVYLNGQLVPGSGTQRTIITPPLGYEHTYQYWVTITFDRDGQKQTEYRKVVIGAGEYTVADFTRLAPQVPNAHFAAGPLDVNWIRQTTTPLRSTWTPPWSPAPSGY